MTNPLPFGEPNAILSTVAQVLAGFWDFPAEAMGQRRQHWADAWAVDSGLPVRELNNATLLRPLDSDGAADLVQRLEAFYSDPRSEGFILWDSWQTVDLTPLGFRGFRQPCMIRPAGGLPPAAPQELEIVLVNDLESLAAFESVLIRALPMPELQDRTLPCIWDERILGSDLYRLWIGFANGRPVSTSMTYLAHGYAFVGFVSTIPEMRRRGYGEALTWRAALADPTRPAVLHASDMGRPIYAKMGFHIIGYATLWLKPIGVAFEWIIDV